MRHATGSIAHGLMAMLTLLSGGAIALSLLTAPPVAQKQVQGAAANTVSSSSFVLTDVASARERVPSSALGGRTSETNVLRVAYQSPDRILYQVTEEGHKVTLLTIGNNRYERAGPGRWTLLPPVSSSGISIGAAEVGVLLQPLESLTDATSVVQHDSSYSLVPSERSALLSSLFGAEALSVWGVRLAATINGEFVGHELISARQGSLHYTFDLEYSSVDKVPPIEAPPPYEILPG